MTRTLSLLHFHLLLLPFLQLLPSATAATDTPFLGFPSPWARPVASNTTEDDESSSWAAAHAKAVAFVAGLTLTEKVNLTTGTGWEADRCIGMTGGVPRVGFRGLCLMDGPVGVRYTDKNSVFPAGVNVAATFSRRLMRLRGEALGAEFRGKGVDVMLGPVAGALGRVPQGGRNWEGFSPDPYLTGVAIAETVGGIQSRGVVACAKHYILNEQEHYRGSIDVRIDDRTMHELYLWPFADAVRAGVGSVMCSYNKINGTYACENEWTTNYLLKNELGFQGFVMSDWGAQHTTLGSALGGLDMAMPGDGGPAPYRAWWGGALTEAVLRGDVPQWRLDDMAVRIMTAYFRVHTGNYTSRPDINFSAWTNQTVGPLYPAANQSFTVVNEHVDVQSDHASLIREIGAKSIVLLKNQEGLLPLNKPATLAIVGDDARDHPLGPNACPERGCLNGTLAMGYGSGTAEFPYLVSPLTALQLQVQADNTTLIKAVTSNWDLDAARAAAAAADVAIVFAAATAGENFITIDGNAGDRNNLTLWANGDALIRAVAGVNPNTVVVLHTPGPVIIDYAEQHPNVSAILWAGLPGQESGNALVDVLYGRVNPQGRTPFSWGKSVEDYGAQLLFRAENPRAPTQTFDEGVFIDYRWFVKQGMRPTYPFGFGLSYTRFQYSGLSVQLREGARARYEAATGETGPAPTLGVVEPELERHTAPEGFSRISPYVYPWLNNSVSLVSNSTAAGQFPPAAKNGSSQPVLPASGAPGGNPGLFEVMYTATVTINNVGKVAGTEIPQLYIQLGGSDNPFSVLRGFDEVELAPGESKNVTFELTRRDVSNWNTATQNWEITDLEKLVLVGGWSTNTPLSARLPAPAGMTWRQSWE